MLVGLGSGLRPRLGLACLQLGPELLGLESPRLEIGSCAAQLVTRRRHRAATRRRVLGRRRHPDGASTARTAAVSARCGGGGATLSTLCEDHMG